MINLSIYLNFLLSLFILIFKKPKDALHKIEKAIQNSHEYKNECYYLIFEKGWFNISQLEWKEAQIYFLKVVEVSMGLGKFDYGLMK